MVKAAPVLTSDLDETMCVAGAVTSESGPEWIRLHPVPFRDLADNEKFKKYQQIDVELIRPKSDRRPESWTPIEGSLRLGQTLDTSNGWADRRQLVEQLYTASACEVFRLNSKGSGVGVPSLAVVRTAEPPQLRISERDSTQLTEWNHRADLAKGRISLFDNPAQQKPDFEVIPWRFQYVYRCEEEGCRGHEQTIVDWEIAALWRHVRYRSDWQEKMREKLENTLWQGRAAMLFVGNQEQHPGAFLVLGVFWPPDDPYQPRLL